MISPIKDSSIRLTSCSRALSKSGLEDVDFSLNPYFGCAHGCLYCYAPDVTRCRKGMEWGLWVEAKTNISRQLKKEIKGIGESVIGLATVTDPYQPAEKQLRLTRACLEVISESDASLMLMTKSPLVLRDIDIIEKIGKAEVCVSITTLDERTSSLFESRVSKPKDRLEILRKFSDKGIKTDAMVSPLLLSGADLEEEIEQLIDAIYETGCNGITFDRLRLRDIGKARIRNAFFKKDSDEVSRIISASEEADLKSLCRSILHDGKYKRMKIQMPMLDWK